MIKKYVLDTNVLLMNPNALFAFEDNDVIIPEIVIEELDNFKKGHQEINVNAREIGRKLRDLKLKNKNSLFEGIKLENGGTLCIKNPFYQGESKIPNGWEEKKRDNDILNTCLALMESNEEVVLVTQDIYLGIKADYLKIKNENFKKDSVKNLDEQYTGIIELCADDHDFCNFSYNKSIEIEKLYQSVHNENEYTKNYDFERYPNEFVILHNALNYKSTLLGRIDKTKKFVKALVHSNEFPFDVKPRNATQIFMQEALMDSVDDTPLVLIKGPAGTAKTFYSLAVALERIYNQNNPDHFRKLLICRPNKLMEDDLGYLPGTEREKIDPLMRPIFDNISVLVDSDEKERYSSEKELQDKVNEIFSRNMIDMQAIGYLRGRSIERNIIMIDETQNVTANTAMAIVTRAGEGTKVIICGDPQQIDNQYLDSKTNGLSYLVEKMKNSPLCSVITTSEKDVVRSKLAKEAVKYLCNNDS